MGEVKRIALVRGLLVTVAKNTLFSRTPAVGVPNWIGSRVEGVISTEVDSGGFEVAVPGRSPAGIHKAQIIQVEKICKQTFNEKVAVFGFTKEFSFLTEFIKFGASLSFIEYTM